MKKLTLDQAWESCLVQWAEIIEQKRKFPKKSIESLKAEWTGDHNFNIRANCFFCEYSRYRNIHCEGCPGRKVDEAFNCKESAYHYKDEPEKFYKKLLELNDIRKGKEMSKMIKLPTSGKEVSEDTIVEALKKHVGFEEEEEYIFQPGDIAEAGCYKRIIIRVDDELRSIADNGKATIAKGQADFEAFSYEKIGRLEDIL